METTVIVKNGQLPESVQDILRHKASKLPRFFDRTTLVQVIVDMRHAQPKVEIIVSAEEANDFFATDSGANVVNAFDGALNKIEIQLIAAQAIHSDRIRQMPWRCKCPRKTAARYPTEYDWPISSPTVVLPLSTDRWG